MKNLNVPIYLLDAAHEAILDAIRKIETEYEYAQLLYTIDSGYGLYEEIADNGNAIVIGKNSMFRVTVYVNINKSSIDLIFNTYNASLVSFISSLNRRVEAEGGLNKETVSISLNDRNRFEPTKAQLKLAKHSKFLIDKCHTSLTTNEVMYNIQDHPYITTKKLNGPVLQHLVEYFSVGGRDHAVLVPLFNVQPVMDAGQSLTSCEVISHQRIGSDLNKRYVEDGFAGYSLYHNEQAKTLIIGEGVINVALTHFAQEQNDNICSAIAVGSSTSYSQLRKLLPKYEHFDSFILVLDNDANNEVNGGIEEGRKLAESLVNAGKQVAIQENYLNRNNRTDSSRKVDVWDYFDSVSFDEFVKVMGATLPFAKTENELKINARVTYHYGATKAYLESLPKRLKISFKDIIEKYRNQYVNWLELPEVLELAGDKKLGSVDAVMAGIFNYIGYDYNAYRNIIETTQVLLDTVKVSKNGVPSIDTTAAISEPTKNKLVIAPMGAGKTEKVIRPIIERGSFRHCIISASVALTKQLSTSFNNDGFVYYKDATEGSTKVTTTIDSCHKFLKQGSICVIDEIHQVIQNLSTDERCKINRELIVKQLRQIATDDAVDFVGTSADIDDSTYTFCRELFQAGFKVAIFGYKSSDNNNTKVKATRYTRKTDYRNALIQELESGGYVIAVSDSIKENKRTAAIAKHLDVDYIMINSQNKTSELSNAASMDKKRLIIVSPSGSTGISFKDTERAVFAYRTGVIPIEEMIQLMSRSRKRSALHVFDSTTGDSERERKLVIEEREAVTMVNRNRLNGLLLEILHAKYKFDTFNTSSFFQAMDKKGYQLTTYDSIEAGDLSKNQYRKLTTEINTLIAYNENLLTQETLSDYKSIVEGVNPSELEKILDDSIGSRNTDKEKIAATLELTQSLSVDGMDLYDKQFHAKGHVFCLEMDHDGSLLRRYNAQQDTKKPLNIVNYEKIKDILVEMGNVEEGNSRSIHDLIDALSPYIEDDFINFQGSVLPAFGVKLKFLRAALKHTTDKYKLLGRLIKEMLVAAGYSVYRNEYYNAYATTRSNILKYNYKKASASITDEDKLPDTLEISSELNEFLVDTF